MTSFNKIPVLFFLMLMAVSASAQQDSTIQPLTNAFQWQYNRYANEVITQPLLKTNRYGIVGFSYGRTSGDFRMAQAPEKQRAISFYSEGTRKVRKMLLSGSFTYINSQIDSQAYTLRMDHLDPNPYFYYTPRPGNWQTIRYKLHGILSYPLFNNKVYVGAGAHYNGANGWRSNDPRPEEFNYDLQASGTIHYKIQPQHTIGAAGKFIRKNTDQNWEYRNDNNHTKPELKVLLQNGYGNVEQMSGLKAGRISSETTGYAIEGIYEGNFAFGTITARGSYQLTNASNFNKPSRDETKYVYGDFEDDIYSASLHWNRETGKNIFNIALRYSDELGKDYNTLLAGNNYIYSMNQTGLNALWSSLNEDKKMKYELGAGIELRDQSQIDGATSQRARYQTGEVNLSGAYYFYFPDQNSMLKAAIRAAYKHPFQAEIAEVSQQFNFTQGVVYRDYYYFNSKTSSIGGAITYQMPVLKTSAYIQLQGNYIAATLPETKNNIIPYTYPGKNRMQWQCSIGLNL